MNKIVAEKRYLSGKLGVDYSSLSQSFLRAETQLTTTSVIPFEFQSSQVTTSIVTEKLLELNDEFALTQVGVFLKQVGADSPTDLQHLNSQLLTWNDPQTFTGTNAANVGAIYNADLSFTINRTQFIPAIDTRDFRRVPNTQQNSNALASGTATTPADTFSPIGTDEVNLAYSFLDVDPTLIDGRQTLDININLGSSVTFDDASNFYAAVAILRGYLITNAKS